MGVLDVLGEILEELGNAIGKEIIKQRKRDLEELKRQEKTLEETLYDL